MIAHSPVELVPHDPQWPQAFQRIRDRLLTLLPQALSIDHIGSTSIPGMTAKPLIDIDIVLPDLGHIEGATRVLLVEGYEPRGNRYDDEVWAFLSRGSVLKRNGSTFALPATARIETGWLSGIISSRIRKRRPIMPRSNAGWQPNSGWTATATLRISANSSMRSSRGH